MSSLGHQLATSVLVIGAGEEGLRAAIEVAEARVAVMVVARCPGESRQTGCHGNRPEQRGHDGPTPRRFAHHEYGGSAILGEDTGTAARRALRERAKRLGVPVLSGVHVTRLLVDHGTVFGAYGFDLVDGVRYLVHADSVILANGGHTRIWRRTSARRHENTGDAFRLAVEAGARLRSPELVRFHPFGLIGPENAAGVLLSDAARGEGGILLNNLGERFMTRYDAERMELVGRDRVALASHTEIREGRGTRGGGVWLDLSHLPRETVLTRLPQLHQSLLRLQMLDITHDPVEVAPTAQSSLGGVWVRPEDHGTDVNGLYAVGEAAGGLHGGDRSAELSPVEPLLRSRIAGRAAAEYSAELVAQHRSPAAVRAAETDVDRLLAADGHQDVRALLRTVRHLMTECAGVVRDESGLAAGLAGLDEIEELMRDIAVHIDIGGFQDLVHAYDLRSAVLAARATLECARERRETRGCHNRSDYPDVDPVLSVDLVWSPTTGVRHEPVPSGPGRQVR
ncbi:FAD-binding protein [Streptomyces sp. NPDC017966]|uniref:FAD-binding protein n=1 Tax=Streptomyces sp. NPDC017966 TaxID=3365023 RepID=UPI0037983673